MAGSKTPGILPKIQLSAGEHTVRLVRCGYKTWEEKITVAQGMVVALKPVLDKI
jgi:hypothetical protein